MAQLSLLPYYLTDAFLGQRPSSYQPAGNAPGIVPTRFLPSANGAVHNPVRDQFVHAVTQLSFIPNNPQLPIRANLPERRVNFPCPFPPMFTRILYIPRAQPPGSFALISLCALCVLCGR